MDVNRKQMIPAPPQVQVQLPKEAPKDVIADYKKEKITIFENIVNFLKKFIAIFSRKITTFTTNPNNMTDKTYYRCSFNKNIRFFRCDIDKKGIEVGVVATAVVKQPNQDGFKCTKEIGGAISKEQGENLKQCIDASQGEKFQPFCMSSTDKSAETQAKSRVLMALTNKDESE